jgi:hypothetical protein
MPHMEDTMSDPMDQLVEGLRVDRTNLYREDVFTDLKVATIKKLTPIKIDGTMDTTRPVTFIGQTQIMSQMGPLPVQCTIEATSLEQAIERFPAAARVAVEEMIQEAREMQRQEMGRIVVPDAGTASKILS